MTVFIVCVNVVTYPMQIPVNRYIVVSSCKLSVRAIKEIRQSKEKSEPVQVSISQCIEARQSTAKGIGGQYVWSVARCPEQRGERIGYAKQQPIDRILFFFGGQAPM